MALENCITLKFFDVGLLGLKNCSDVVLWDIKISAMHVSRVIKNLATLASSFSESHKDI